MQESVISAPFIDPLNRLEQLGILQSSEDWLLLRQARNSSSHKYADTPEEGAAFLISLVPLVDLLLSIQSAVE